MKQVILCLSFFVTAIAPIIFFHSPKHTEARIQFCLRNDRHQLFAEKELVPFSSRIQVTGDLDSYDEYEYDKTGAATQNQQDDQMLELLKISKCPSGILFKRPQQLASVTSDGEPFCYKESICNAQWKCNVQKNAIVAELIKIGKPSTNEAWTFTEGDSLLKNCSDCMQCQQPSSSLPHLHSESHYHHSRVKREISGKVPSEPTSIDQIQREIDDQTKRMFYYLAGINQDEVNSHLRVVKLFKMSTQLVSMICDPQYIRPKFLREIERGFLFLLKEQGFDKLVDLELETYNQLQKTLEHCASTVQMVKFMGQPCPTGIRVDKVYKLEGNDGGDRKMIDYERSSKTFKWGDYDVVLDGAWSTMSIVHAGCFNSFSGKVNLLHKFEVALEQLFHSALIKRWEHPTRLTDDWFYDSMFMARVNDTLEAMDACTRFLYLMTPFGIQMNRPIHETFYRRKKRSVPQEPSYSSDEESIGKAFSSMENSIETSHQSTLPMWGSSSSEKMDEYGNDDLLEFECLETDEERNSKIKLAQKMEYNGCKKASSDE